MAPCIILKHLFFAVEKKVQVAFRCTAILFATIVFSEQSHALGQKIYEDHEYIVSMFGEFCAEHGTEILVQGKISTLDSPPPHIIQIVKDIAQHECTSPEFYSFITDLTNSVRPSGKFFNWPRGYLNDEDPLKYVEYTPFFNTAKNEFNKIIYYYNNLKKKELSHLLNALEAKYIELSEKDHLYIHAVNPRYSGLWLREAREMLLGYSIYETSKLIDPEFYTFTDIFSSLPEVVQKGDTYKRYQGFTEKYPRILMWLPDRKLEERFTKIVNSQLIADTRREFSRSFDTSVDGLVQMKKHFKDYPSNNDFISEIANILTDDYPSPSYGQAINFFVGLKTTFQEAFEEKREKVTSILLKNYSNINDPLSRIDFINRTSASKFFDVVSEITTEKIQADFSAGRALAINQIASNNQAWAKEYLSLSTDFSAKIHRISSILFGTDIRNAEFGEYPFPLDQIRDTIVRINWNASKTNQTHPVVAKVPQTKPNASLVDHFLKQSKMYQVTLKGVTEINITKVDEPSGIISYRTKFILGNGPFKGKEHLLVGHTIGQLSTSTANVREYRVGFSKKQCSITHLQSIGLERNSYIETAPGWLVEEYDNLLLNKVWAQKSRDVGKMNCVSYQLPTRHSCPKLCNKKMEVLQEPTFLTATKAEAFRLNNFLAKQGLSLTEKGALEATMYQNHLNEMQRQHDLWVKQQNDNESQFQTILMIMGM